MMKLRNLGATAVKALESSVGLGWEPRAGSFLSKTMMVTMMAKTPSLKASRRLVLGWNSVRCMERRTVEWQLPRVISHDSLKEPKCTSGGDKQGGGLSDVPGCERLAISQQGQQWSHREDDADLADFNSKVESKQCDA